MILPIIKCNHCFSSLLEEKIEKTIIRIDESQYDSQSQDVSSSFDCFLDGVVSSCSEVEKKKDQDLQDIKSTLLSLFEKVVSPSVSFMVFLSLYSITNIVNRFPKFYFFSHLVRNTS